MANEWYVQPAGDFSQGLSGLGAVLNHAMAQKTEREAEETARAESAEAQTALYDAYNSGDPVAVAEVALKYPKISEQANTARGLIQDYQKQEATDFATEILTNPGRAAEIAERRMAILQGQGRDPKDTAKFYEMYQQDPEGAMRALEMNFAGINPEAYKAYRETLPTAEEGFTLAPGAQRYDAQGNLVVANPANDRAATASTDIGKAKQDLDNGFITLQQFNEIASRPGASASDPFKDSSELRKEFSGIQTVKDFAQQATAMGRIAASASDPSPAGDLSLIFNYMKVLDPGSTVREGEFANAQNAGAIDDKVIGLYNRIINGERLSVDQRADFVKRGQGLYKDAETQYGKVFDQYKGIAQRRGLPVEDTLVDYRYYGAPSFVESAQQPPIQGGIVPPNPGGSMMGAPLSPEEQQELQALRARYGR